MSRIDVRTLLIAVLLLGGVTGCSKSVDPDPGVVTIVCAPASITPTWSLQGPGGLTVNGDGDSTMPSMAAGAYTLTWGGVSGWTTPAPNPETQSLAGGGSITFSGTYTRGVFFNSANGHYYQLVEQDLSWTAARTAAASASYQGLPGHLATVSDAAENTFIYALEGNTDGAWLGGYQESSAGDYAEPSGGWRWVTGEPFSYTHWYSGEPNNRNANEHYLGFGSDTSWNDWDLNGSYVYSYIIEYEPAPREDVYYNSSNGHYYQLVEQDLSWTEARAAAASASYQGLPGHLATVSDAAENTFIYALEGNTDGAWLGGYQDRSAGDYAEPAGGWRWVTGEPFSYTHWCSGEPNNRNTNEHYLGFGGLADCWNDWDLNGSYVYGYIIEYEP